MNAACVVLLCSTVATLAAAAAAEIRVPGFTSYLEPDQGGARISARAGVVNWTNPDTRVVWHGQILQPGSLEARVELRLPEGSTSRLRLTVANQAREAAVTGAGTNPAVARFGSFDIRAPGYTRFVLESLNPSGRPAGEVAQLILAGAPIEKAHFNLKPRRNAASVHLGYPGADGTNVAVFYCEMTGLEDPVHTYYMACGWHRGYFGMQVNSPTERRIIFSVWDSGGEAVDRKRVAETNRVTLLSKGEGVSAGDFGNEGTGGHSHLKFAWRTGEPQRFLVTAQPTNQTFTIYSGYYFHPGTKTWMLISSWRAPRDGGWLRRLYSFSENFVGNNGQVRRKALYGNQWIRTEGGDWIELTKARFSHDATGREDRLDRFMGVEQGEFFLSQGGFVDGFTKSGELFTRPATGRRPEIDLPGFTRHEPATRP